MSRPSLDDDARALGRQRAMEARRRRAEVKSSLSSGEGDLVALLAQRRDPVLSRLRVREVITALPGVGPAGAGRILTECAIEGERRLGQLGDLQVQRLLSAVHAREAPELPARLLVLSGPSGVGKSSVVAYLREHHPALWFSVSVTTRTPRPGEVDGVDYHFITQEAFDRLVDEGELLEWAVFAGNSYGTPAAPVHERLERGEPVICEIDLQGARQLRSRAPHSLLVFLAPPSWQVLVERLTGRGTESPEVVAERLETARRELAAESEFDVVVVNDSVAGAAEEIVRVLTG